MQRAGLRIPARLVIGEALEELGRRGWHHELGFSSLTAYVLERCCQSGRWGIDTCALTRKLAKLPVLRAALVKSTLTWSRVELLARHATPETEAGLVSQAAGSTVRRMRALLRAAKGEAADAKADEDPDTARATVSVTLSAQDAWLLEHVRWSSKGSRRSPHSSRGKPSPIVRIALNSSAKGPLRGARSFGPGARRPRPRDLLFGALAEKFWKSDGWRRLGYASEAQYARERLGVSISSIKTKRALPRRGERMPGVTAAIERRALGFEAALLVTRVATERTVEAWIARASERTIKLLRQEVAAAELRIRFGEPDDERAPRVEPDIR